MKNKRMMSAAIAVLMAGSLAACGGSTTASSTADSTPASTASLQIKDLACGISFMFLPGAMSASRFTKEWPSVLIFNTEPSPSPNS